MRHGVAGYRLGRNKDQRNALRRILINQLFEHERIRTTRAKAQAIRGDAERLITLARRSADGSDTQKMNARRLAASKMANADMVRKLFDDIGPRFANRPGGYTRMLRMGLREGDAADMVLLELVED
jgi:large subunit ribosomal protein L17